MAEYSAPDVERDEQLEDAPKDYVPEGYETPEKFLEHARGAIQDDYDADKNNRDMALEDLQFIASDQWDPVVKAARKGRPCPIINTLPQMIGQVIGDRRMNKTAIKARPVKDATQADAEKIAAIIKGIEYRSRADRAYDMGLENQVSCGIGNLRVLMDYATDDVFEQDIIIKGIPNPLAVIWDRFSFDPTGRDANRCTVQDSLDTKTFEAEWPDKQPDETLIKDLALRGRGWFEKNKVRVCEFWEMIPEEKMFGLTPDGAVIDIGGQDVRALIEQRKIAIDPNSGQPIMRKGICKYARMHLITGTDILTEEYRMPINRLPIIRVEGRIVNIGDERYRYSLIRPSKDSVRMRNYWRGVQTEVLAMAPKGKWLAEDASVAGYEEDFRNAATSTNPLLLYKQGQKEPKWIEPPTIPAALIQAENANAQDIKDTTGIHDASLGIRSNETSGVAIRGRQMEGDVATIMFHDNTNAAILEVGDVVAQLLPYCYDTVRTLLAVGVDEKDMQIEVNNPRNPESLDLSRGKYTIAIETGPSFTTQREEGAQAMIEMIKVAPEVMGMSADLIAKYMDFPGAQEIAKRIEGQMKAKGMLPEDDQGQQQPLTPQLAQQIEQAAVQKFLESEQGKMAQLELRLKEAEVREAEAKAEEAEHNADEADAKAQTAATEIFTNAAQAAKPVPAAAPANRNRRSGKPKGNRK
jgi:hypothetical protein